MTGRDVIDFINKNNAEDMEIVVVDQNSLWQQDNIETSKIEVVYANGKKVLLIS